MRASVMDGSSPSRPLDVLLITPCPVKDGNVEICFGGIQRLTQIVAANGLPGGMRLHFVDTAIWNVARFKQASAWTGEFRRGVRIMATLLRLMLTRRFDLVFIESTVSRRGLAASWIYARLARMHRLPVVSRYHGDVAAFVQQSNRPGRPWPLHSLLRTSNASIAVNRQSLECMEVLLGGRERTHLLPNCIEDSVLNGDGLSKRSPGRPRFLYAGQVMEAKGCRELLSAAEAVPEADFVLLGIVHKEMDDDLRRAPANVEWIGPAPQDVVFREMRKSDVFVLPSWQEGFPMAVVEAMATGLPVVCTPAGAMGDMVEDGKGGILVPVRDIPKLVEALRSLARDPRRCARMGQFNREKARAEYAYSVFAPRLAAIFRRAARGTGGAKSAQPTVP